MPNPAPNSIQKRLPLTVLGLGIICCLGLIVAWSVERPRLEQARPATPARSAATTPTPTVAQLVSAPNAPAPTPTPAATNTPAPPPTPTSTRVVVDRPDPAATAKAVERATRQAQTKAQAAAQLGRLAQPKKQTAGLASGAVSFGVEDRLVLAHYFAWFDGDGWNDCNISAGDKPQEPYHSDDPAAIARHLALAQQAGLDGFTLHWFAPGGRTDANFRTLLRQSEGTGFASTVVFSRHIWHGGGINAQTLSQALNYLIEQYSSHPNFLRWEQKPVIFFTDVYRTPAAGQTPQQFWASLRDQVDPQRQTVWIAEGLEPSYLTAFDGLYVFKISHAAYPHDYQKSPRWGDRVRSWSQRLGQEKLWIATMSPGWDDRRAGCKADVRVANTPHRLGRAGGDIYQATFEAALQSQPDWLILSSFNEWVEGTYIEPSEQYGDKYLRLTREFARRFRAE